VRFCLALSCLVFARWPIDSRLSSS
jgi:hypothetical protein